MNIRLSLIIFFLLTSILVRAGFPDYYDVNLGEIVKVKWGSPVKIVAKKVTWFDSAYNRLGSADVTIEVNKKEYVIPVGYEHAGTIIENMLIGVDYISDYDVAFKNDRIRLDKEVRIWIAKAGEKLLPENSFVHPLFTPWNSGFRNQNWLAITFNIEDLEGKKDRATGRYHDGCDLGIWEGQLVRSVSDGIVISPDDYPKYLDKSLFYNKNGAPVGPNAFLVKHETLPLIFYYTHMSGLSRQYQKGEKILKGEVLGYASSRGSSGGWYHLHFSMIHTGLEAHINPFPYIKEWYGESMPHYTDFLTEYGVFLPGSSSKESKYALEKRVVEGIQLQDKSFSGSLPGIVHVREAVAERPFAGLNHIVFDQFAVLKSSFEVKEAGDGELWFGHTGVARVYLNGMLVYSGENKSLYHRSAQPFQWDSQMIPVKYSRGKNEVVVAIEQTNPHWSFALRPRDRLGRPLEEIEER